MHLRFALNRLLICCFLILATTGCTQLADDIATRAADSDLKLSRDVRVIHGDLIRFRSCLSDRGGSCSGTATTPLSDSIEDAAGRTIRPVSETPSRSLSESLADKSPDHPANAALAALHHPLARKVAALHDVLRGHSIDSPAGVEVTNDEEGGKSSTTVKINTNIPEVRDYLRTVSEASSGQGWDALHEHCQQLLKSAAQGPSAAMIQDCRTAAFIKGYLAAYFRHGDFIEVELDSDGVVGKVQAAAGKVDQEIENRAGAAAKTADRALQGSGKLIEGAGKSVATGVDQIEGTVTDEIRQTTDTVNREFSNIVHISSIGFVSRDTLFSAKVPAFELVIDPTAKNLLRVLDADTGQQITRSTQLSRSGVVSDKSGIGTDDQVVAELIRVILEALFDSHEGLPAVSQPPPISLTATGLDLGAASLPLFKSPMGHVSAADLSRMATINSEVALNVRVVLGELVGGIGPLSLNNSALETLIVEALTTSVRKAVEKITWCWYSCNLDQDVSRTRDDFEHGVHSLVDGSLQDAAGLADQKIKQAGTQARQSASREISGIRLSLKVDH